MNRCNRVLFQHILDFLQDKITIKPYHLLCYGGLMKKLILILSLLSTQMLLAEDFYCTTSYNGETSPVEKVSVTEGETTMFGNIEGFKFRLKQYKAFKHCLDIFDAENESRYYSCATAQKADDKLEWAIWTRNRLMEISCKVVK